MVDFVEPFDDFIYDQKIVAISKDIKLIDQSNKKD